MRERWQRLGVGTRAVLVVLALALVGNLFFRTIDSATRGRDDSGPISSSLSTGNGGLAAYASLLERYGHRVESVRGALAETLPDPSATLVILDAAQVSAREQRTIRDFVRSGGRLIAGGRFSDWVDAVVADPPTFSSGGTRRATPVAVAPETTGVRVVRLSGQGSWNELGSNPTLLAGNGHVVLTRMRVGAGTVFLLADPSPLQNARLGQADNAALGLALGGASARPVLFAEGVHGYGTSTGLDAIPTRWKVALIGFLLAALLTLIVWGRRIGPPEDEARDFPPARRVYVDALATQLARTKEPAEALAPLQRSLREQVARRSALPHDAEGDAVRAAARQLGWPPELVEAMFTTVDDRRRVLLTGRAAARAARGEP